jgi:hypothetical protein
VLTNFSGGAQETKMGSLSGKRVQILKANFAPGIPNEVLPNTLTLPPYGALVAEVD